MNRMNFFFILAVVLSASQVKAQTLKNLFPPSAYLTNINIPFEVNSTSEVSFVTIEFPTNEANCRFLLDPFHSKIFHVRCSQSGDVTVKAIFTRDGNLEYISSPVLAIKTPQGGVIINPKPPEDDPRIAKGNDLFNKPTSYNPGKACIGCHHAHGNPRVLRGYSVQDIKKGFNKSSDMDPYQSMSTSDLEALSAYLRSLK